MSEAIKPTPGKALKIQEAHELAKAAISRVINAIAYDPRKYWLMGEGTESWAQLTTAAAAIWGIPVEQVRKDFAPDKEKYDSYCAQQEADERLLHYCRQKGITVPTE